MCRLCCFSALYAATEPVIPPGLQLLRAQPAHRQCTLSPYQAWGLLAESIVESARIIADGEHRCAMVTHLPQPSLFAHSRPSPVQR